MWIIPRNLHTSHSVQATEELTSDSRERLAELFAQSLMWRSKPSPSRTWSRRLKTDTSTQRLSTRTLKPSHGEAFKDEWTSSLAGSLVSHLAAPDEEPETRTPDTSSPTSSTDLESWDGLPLFSWRTSMGSSHQSSRATDGQTPKERPFCYMSSESWSAWVTTRRREYSARVKSARPINESACLLWRVAPISASQEGLLFRGCLSEGEAQTWNTPQARDYKGAQGRAYKGEALDLPAQVQPTPPQEAQMWGTPRVGTAQASGGGGNPNAKEFNFRLENQARPTPPQEVQSSTHGNRPALLDAQGPTTPAKLKLNPRWVETLMGLPVGWVMPSCVDPWTVDPTSCAYLETESCQTQPGEPSASCGEISPSEDDEP
jgi:hypothetical protein